MLLGKHRKSPSIPLYERGTSAVRKGEVGSWRRDFNLAHVSPLEKGDVPYSAHGFLEQLEFQQAR